MCHGLEAALPACDQRSNALAWQSTFLITLKHSAGMNGGFSNWAFGSSSFCLFFGIVFAHPGHASLRSLIDVFMPSLHACVGLAVESLALGRASRCAAAIFGFIHEPRPVRTTPFGFGVRRFSSYCALHLRRTELGAICPHAMEQNSQFSRDRDDSATSAFGAH